MILASAENRLFMHGGTRKGWFGKAKLGVTPSQSFVCHVKVLFDRFSFVCFVHLFSSGGKHKAKLHFHFDR